MSHASLFSELKRRNVFRAAAFYAAAAWLVVQIATQVFPVFSLPDWVARLVVIAVIIGFPFAMAFAWFYELTAEGLKRESEVDPSASIMQATGRRIDRWIIVVLGLAVVFLLATTLVTRDSDGDAAGLGKSIAVLPFENLSADQSNAYFTDGVQDEILARLSKIGALRVISRTSTAQYASKPTNLREIGKQLGVAYVLEGSVQKAGQTVRITVQLTEVASDRHLWAESYDRKLDDIFGVESEVAQTIASALEIKLSGGELAALEMRPTSNPDAYDAYLRGLAIESRRLDMSPDMPRRAASQYAEATRADPDFALAWARLAIVESYMYFNSIDRTPALAADVKHAADTAIALQPDLGEAHLAQGYFRYRCLHDFNGGLRAFEQARERLPNNANVLAAISYIQRRQGNWNESAANLERATQLDPRASTMLTELATTYSSMREYNKARATLDRALAAYPDASAPIAAKAATWLAEGDLDQARKLLDAVSANPEDTAYQVKTNLLIYERNFPAAVAAFNAWTQVKTAPTLYRADALIGLGWAQIWAGNPSAAHDAFGQALAVIQNDSENTNDNFYLAMDLAFAYAGLGQKADAHREAQRAVDLTRQDALLYPGMLSMQAQIEVRFGELDIALAALPPLLTVPAGVTTGDLLFNPMWDPLRHDPRFIALESGNRTAVAKP